MGVKPPEREALARTLSPINYVRPHGPAVITCTAMPIGRPLEHARRWPRRSTPRASQQGHHVRGGKHGDFGGNDMVRSVRPCASS